MVQEREDIKTAQHGPGPAAGRGRSEFKPVTSDSKSNALLTAIQAMKKRNKNHELSWGKRNTDENCQKYVF